MAAAASRGIGELLKRKSWRQRLFGGERRRHKYRKRRRAAAKKA